jgi:cytochrome c peroxidase
MMSAEKNDGLGSFSPEYLNFPQPKGWPKPVNDIFKKNRLSEQGFQLGKKLFYDGQLSSDGLTSCGSCHQQFAAFSTYDHDLSHGVDNSLSTRNAPALFNLAWMNSYHWDGGINHIEVQPLSPLTAKNEMGETINSVLEKIKKDSSYRRMFKAAFGDAAITSQRLLRALSQFTGSLVSANSKYDKVQRGELKFTAVEERGYQVFKRECSACHKEPLFTDNSFRNNGISLNRFKDAGRASVTGIIEDSMKFKVPSLRNTQLSFPYMHDGRYYALSHVIEHYRSKIDSTDLRVDPLVRKRLKITTAEKNELIYFLYTLTDTSFTKNPRFAPSAEIVYKH